MRNTGPLTNLLGWESQDDLGARAHFLFEPSDKLSVLLSGDYLNSKGTGSRGVDFFNAALSGLTYDDFDDPRKVNQAASARRRTPFTGALHSTRPTARICSTCSTSAAIATCTISNSLSTNGRNYDFDGDEAAIVIAAMRAGPDGPLADEYVAERYYGNYGALIWDTTSESRTHELRFTSPDSAERLTWAVGALQVQGRAGACFSASRSTTRRSSVPGIQPGLDDRRIRIGLCGHHVRAHRSAAHHRRRALLGRKQGA